MTRFFVVLAALALAACATATPYQPAARNGDYGYVERKIEDNRYTIQFNGNSITERETVESYLLFRAAELTLQHGFDYFVVSFLCLQLLSRLYVALSLLIRMYRSRNLW